MTDENLEKLKELVRDKFHVFPQIVSNNLPYKHITFIANKIQRAIEAPHKSQKHKLLIFSLPPQNGKTELISKHLPAWYLGKYPKKRIILTSYGAEWAQDNSAVAKEIFATWSPIFFNVYPSETNFSRARWNTEYNGGMVACGVDGPITGSGASLFIIDDFIKSWVEAESQKARDDVWTWWLSGVNSRLRPNAVIIILATRWNDDDLIGRLLKQKEEDGDNSPFLLEYINLPAIAEENDLLGRKPGEPLCPEWYSLEFLENKKKAIGSYWWSALYQGRPSPRGGTLFKSESFRYYTFNPKQDLYFCFLPNQEPIKITKADLIKWAFVDPALELKKESDPTGIACWGYNRQHKVWLLLDRFVDRIDITQASKIILNFAFKNDCRLIYVENEKIGKILVKQSAGADLIGGKRIPFRECKTKGLDKFTRAVPMSTYIENGRVFFPKNAFWLAQYESALVTFPKGEHDEDIDITSMAIEMETTILPGLARITR